MTIARLSLILTAATFLAGSAAQAGLVAISHQPPAKNRALAGKPDSRTPNDPYLVACLDALAHGELSRGEEACTQAILVDPKDSDALELRGYGFLLEHRFDKAEEDFRAALQIRPDNAEDLAGYGQSLTGLGEYAQAVVQFGKAVALAPANAAFRNALCWARAGTGKDLDEALGDCDTALMLAPGAPGPLNSHGLVNLRLGRYPDAIADYTASLTASATQPSARFGRGLAHLALGQTAAGSADILAARAGDSDIDGMFIQMGVLPKDCGTEPSPKCPAGFPPPQKGEWLVAQWRVWQ
jgi:tetratricopeptide (TPR) repeat protein